MVIENFMHAKSQVIVLETSKGALIVQSLTLHMGYISVYQMLYLLDGGCHRNMSVVSAQRHGKCGKRLQGLPIFIWESLTL